MTPEFNTVADDFFVNLNIQTTLDLPDGRETILHFCEAVQKEFSSMSNFYRRDTGEFVLEGNRESGSYQWMELQPRRLSTGSFNPSTAADAYRLHAWILERSLYYLGISGLDVECMDVLFGFNLDFSGNRDAVVADALLCGSPMAALAMEAGGKTVECEPSAVVALDEDCYLQGRLWVETRSNSYQVRTGEYDSEPISVYFAVRQYPHPGAVLDLPNAYAHQRALCEDLTGRVIVPQVVHPIVTAIAAGG